MTNDHLDSPDPGVLLSDRRLDAYRGTRTLVTGGLGFIPSNVVRALATLGSSVVAVDSLSPGQGGNRFNLAGIADKVDLRIADIRDEAAMTDAVKSCDFVFNMAASVSHLDSLKDPFPDFDVNARGNLLMLEVIRKNAPAARVVYAGTRSEYGLIQTSPVSETHPLLPTETNSANKAVAGMYHTAYHIAHGLQTVTMRLTTTYGPRMLVKHWRQGFINWFVRLAVEGGTFQLYGDGTQVRDLVYVDDTVRALLLAPIVPGTAGQTFNIGSAVPVSLKEIAEILIDISGKGAIEYTPFPEDAKRIEIGDYVADVTKITDVIDWRPLVSLRDGLERSIRYYQKYGEHYW